MSLKEKIEEYKSKNRKTKADILMNYADEIKEMIDIGMPLKKQIELILENTEINKLQYAEYYNILKNNFGYKGKSKKSFFDSSSTFVQEKKKKNTNKTATDILSSDVDLLEAHLRESIQK